MAMAYDPGAAAGTYPLRAFGFDSTQRVVIQSLCRLSANRSRAYTLLSPGEEDQRPPAICLVNTSDDDAIARWQEVTSRAGRLPSVLVGEHETEIDGSAVYHCTSKRLSSSLLSFLDKIVVEHFGPSSCRDVGVEPDPGTQVAFTSEDGSSVARALVIDDSQAVCAQMQTLLQRQSIDVDVRGDAMSGLEALDANAYDVVFLDVVLPDMEGYKACKRIKANPHTRDIPVIMLTGKGSRFNKVQGRMAGCDRYLTKPASERQVVDALQACLRVFE